MRGAWPLALVFLLGLGACPEKGRKTGGATPRKPSDISLFMISELMGALEPCGCNSDPLGDLARSAALLREARARQPMVLLDGGSTLYPAPEIDAQSLAQAKLKADLLARLLPDLGLAASAVGPADLALGAGGVRLPKTASNVKGLDTEPPRVVDMGGARVGVFGVTAPELLTGQVQATDPVPAAQAAVAALRKERPDAIVALAHMDFRGARSLARRVPGIDFVLAGHDAPDPSVGQPLYRIDRVGDTTVIQPGQKGQVLLRLDLHLEGTGAFVDALGPARAAERLAALSEDIASLEEKLAAWENDPTAEKEFVARKKAELAERVAEKAAIEKEPLRKPQAGRWFVLDVIPIKKKLPCAPDVVKAKQEVDRAVAKVNLEAAKGKKPPPVADGQAGYVGIEECEFCHKEAVDFWKETRHAQAWETLEKLEKQYDRDCIYCHVTGFGKPGGSMLAHTEGLVDVQCESCHGPGSLHVDADGNEKPRSLVLVPPRDTCFLSCHTPEHSDTFDYDAYLRDVTGKGHGEAFREKLGDGPTGRELRQAALDKAGRGIGEHCPK